MSKMADLRDDAFHITAEANIPLIAASGFRADRRGVLGTGAYFDLESDASGWAPARRRYPNQRLVVFRCVIALGRVLDLDDSSVRTRFRQFQRGLIPGLGREEVLRLGQGGHLDAFLQAVAAAGEV